MVNASLSFSASQNLQRLKSSASRTIYRGNPP